MNKDAANPEWFHDYHPVIRHGTWDENIFREQIHYAPLKLSQELKVLDIGAHIGAFNLWAYHNGVRNIESVEMMWPNVQLLLLNGHQGSLRHGTVLNDRHYLDESPPEIVLPSTINTGMYKLITSKQEQDSLRVVIPVTGETFAFSACVLADFDIMKIDIEGYEYELDWHYLKHSFIQRFVVEYHFDIENAKEKASKMHQDIQDAGYKPYHGCDFTHAHQTLGFYERQ